MSKFLNRNKYGVKIDCIYFDPVYRWYGYPCKFDSALHNGPMDCDEKGSCIYNMANKLKNREGTWLPLNKTKQKIMNELDNTLKLKLKELYNY